MDNSQPLQSTEGFKQISKKSSGKANLFIEKIIGKKGFTYLFIVSLLFFLLLCGYFLFFTGSLFIEAVYKGWWKPDASEFDSISFFLGYLYGFPTLCGIIGGIMVLSTNVLRMFKYKVLLIIPSVVWTTLLFLDLLRRPWVNGIFFSGHVLAMLLCVFILFCVVKRVRLPYFT